MLRIIEIQRERTEPDSTVATRHVCLCDGYWVPETEAYLGYIKTLIRLNVLLGLQYRECVCVCVCVQGL